MSLYLAEVIPNQILTHIQNNISASLTAELAVWTDGITPLVQPEQYYDYEEADPPQCPALYVLEDDIDYRLAEKGANFICALATIRCGMILEDFRAKELVHQARRYANVLHQLMNETRLDYVVSGTTKVSNIIKVKRTSFGDSFRKNAASDSQDQPFRKEFVHVLEVEHYENYS